MLSRCGLGFKQILEFCQVSSRREGGRKGVEAVREGEDIQMYVDFEQRQRGK